MIISIHAPREGSDPRRAARPPRPEGFQSTLPVRGATKERMAHLFGFVISIHAPREGSDAYKTMLRQLISISIHAPREGSDSCSGC